MAWLGPTLRHVGPQGDIESVATPSGRVRRALTAGIAAGAVIAVLAPMFRSPPADGFPLSTYPMFARDRGATAWVDTAVGITGDGEVVRLSPELISGSDEPVLAAVTVSRARRDGAGDELCARVAERLVAARFDGVEAVEVVSERQDLDRYEPDEPLDRRIHARCPVGG